MGAAALAADDYNTLILLLIYFENEFRDGTA
jgi:hypothetical protein